MWWFLYVLFNDSITLKQTVYFGEEGDFKVFKGDGFASVW